MHILTFVLIGLGVLGFFIVTGLLLNRRRPGYPVDARSEEHTSELQSH